MTNGLKHEPMTEQQRREFDRINRKIQRHHRALERKTKRILRMQKISDSIRFFFCSRLPDRQIAWQMTGDNDFVPVCPRCGEFVYYRNQCVWCGQHFLPGAKTVGEVMDHGS